METTPENTGIRRPRVFAVWLIAIVVLGVLVRVAYTVYVMRNRPIFTDSIWYYTQGQNIRNGLGLIDFWGHFPKTSGNSTGPPPYATARWPPLYPVFLAGVQSVFGDGVRVSQLGGAITGAATIALTGLLGRAIAGAKVGILAAVLIAFSPYAIAVDGSLLSETLYVPLVLLAFLIAQYTRERPTALAWCALGVTIALAALTRANALFLVPLVVIPTAVLSRDRLRHLLPRVALCLAALALVLAPWVIRNAVKVGEPGIDTLSSNGALASSNCDKVYSGKNLGWWAVTCMELKVGKTMSEADYSKRERARGLDYAFSHIDRWPAVATARVLRVWGLWNPNEQTRVEASQSREVNWQRMAWVTSTATLVLGVAGIVVLARRRRPVAMLVASIALATLIALAAYGNTRFAASAAPTLAIGAAASLLAVRDRFRRDGKAKDSWLPAPTAPETPPEASREAQPVS